MRRDLWTGAGVSLLMALCLLAGLHYQARTFPADPRVEPERHARQLRKAEIDARFKQGVLMLHAKQYEHAVTAFHRVFKLAPNMPEAHVNMGFALIGLKRYDAARDFFESATALRPSQVNAYWGLAVALRGLGDLPGAIGAMRTYLHLTEADDPYLPKARQALQEWEAALATVPKGTGAAAENLGSD